VYVVFATSEGAGSARSVTFGVEQQPSSVAAFELETGRLTRVPITLLDSDQVLLYSATLPAGKSEGWYDTALVIDAPARAAAIKLGAQDKARLARLHGRDFARVTDVVPTAIDLDGNRLPDLAFVKVCIEYPRGDSICGEHAVFAARRVHGTWTLTADRTY